MKIIISSDYLKDGINKALNNKPKEVEINEKQILFHCEGVSIEVTIDKVVKEPDEFKVNVDFLKWLILFKLLNLIPHQPIVVDIDDFQYDEIRIEVSQFSAIF